MNSHQRRKRRRADDADSFFGVDIDPEHPVAKHRDKWMRGENPSWEQLHVDTAQYAAAKEAPNK